MTLRRFLQLDVFAHQPGAGNPLAVVLDADESAEHGRKRLDDQTMQAIARWTRLPETTFVFAPTQPGASYGVRIFSPRREVPFAGHPSVGTAHAVLESGLATPVDGILVQEGLAGLLPLEIHGEGDQRTIAVRTPPSHLLETVSSDDPRIAGALNGLPTGRLPPALMNGGRRWWLVEVSDEAALRAAVPAWEAIGALAQGTGSMGVCAFARAAAGSDYDVVVRAFVGAPGQFEDAASGAANATLAAWLQHNRALPGSGGQYVVSQGREVGFDARLQMRVDPNGDVWSGGSVCSVIRGHIQW